MRPIATQAMAKSLHSLLGAITIQMASAGLLPIFFMHGMNRDATFFDSMQAWVRSLDSEVTMFSLPVAEKFDSIMTNMWKQGDEVIKSIQGQVRARPELYRNGYTLLCHSQGALLCRTVVQRWDDHGVHTLLALSGPQAGEYGIPANMPQWIPGAKESIFSVVYEPGFQDSISIADYWHDPRPKAEWPVEGFPEKVYWTKNTFLPVLNNDPHRETQGPLRQPSKAEADRYKTNLLRLKKAIFACSDKDDQIIPYDSAIFNFYDDDAMVSVPLQNTSMWRDDWLGLRALHSAGSLELLEAPDVCHNCWVEDESIFWEFIAPRLARSKGEDWTFRTWPVVCGSLLVALCIVGLALYCFRRRNNKYQTIAAAGTRKDPLAQPELPA